MTPRFKVQFGLPISHKFVRPGLLSPVPSVVLDLVVLPVASVVVCLVAGFSTSEELLRQQSYAN